MTRPTTRPDLAGRATVALLGIGLLAGLIGFVVLGHRQALAVQQGLITVALLVWVAAKLTRRVRR